MHLRWNGNLCCTAALFFGRVDSWSDTGKILTHWSVEGDGARTTAVLLVCGLNSSLLVYGDD